MNRGTLRKYISFNEGRRPRTYLDSEGLETVGVGFNLRRDGARGHIEGLGVSYDDLLAGRVELAEEQIDALLEPDLDTAIRDAKSIFSNFGDLDETRQIIVADMAFNLGAGGLRGFRNMIAAVGEQNWEKAADEAKDSRWYRQVASRGERNVHALRTGEMPQFS